MRRATGCGGRSTRRVPPPTGDRRVFEYDGGRIEIIREGDEHGEGLVRTCEFRVPRWLGSGGKARSWEVVTEVRPDEYASYEAVGEAPLVTCHRLARAHATCPTGAPA